MTVNKMVQCQWHSLTFTVPIRCLRFSSKHGFVASRWIVGEHLLTNKTKLSDLYEYHISPVKGIDFFLLCAMLWKSGIWKIYTSFASLYHFFLIQTKIIAARPPLSITVRAKIKYLYWSNLRFHKGKLPF